MTLCLSAPEETSHSQHVKGTVHHKFSHRLLLLGVRTVYLNMNTFTLYTLSSLCWWSWCLIRDKLLHCIVETSHINSDFLSDQRRHQSRNWDVRTRFSCTERNVCVSVSMSNTYKRVVSYRKARITWTEEVEDAADVLSPKCPRFILTSFGWMIIKNLSWTSWRETLL